QAGRLTHRLALPRLATGALVGRGRAHALRPARRRRGRGRRARAPARGRGLAARRPARAGRARAGGRRLPAAQGRFARGRPVRGVPVPLPQGVERSRGAEKAGIAAPGAEVLTSPVRAYLPGTAAGVSSKPSTGRSPAERTLA